jgi:hypothetical protein
MSLHPLEQAFRAQSWKQRVDFIQGKYVQEVEHLRHGRSDQSDVFEDYNKAYAVLEAFWHGQYKQFQDNETVDETVMQEIVPCLWDEMTDRLSKCFSTLTNLVLAVC